MPIEAGRNRLALGSVGGAVLTRLGIVAGSDLAVVHVVVGLAQHLVGEEAGEVPARRGHAQELLREVIGVAVLGVRGGIEGAHEVGLEGADEVLASGGAVGGKRGGRHAGGRAAYAKRSEGGGRRPWEATRAPWAGRDREAVATAPRERGGPWPEGTRSGRRLRRPAAPLARPHAEIRETTVATAEAAFATH